MPDVKKTNPYNFVPLGSGVDRSQGYPGRHRLQENSYSGVLVYRLIALGPLVSVDHRTYQEHQLKDPDGNPALIQKGKRTGQPWGPIKVFHFLRNQANEPIIQGASLKGMVRSLYEAMVNACLPLATTEGTSQKFGTDTTYKYKDLGNYQGEACNHLEHLCPACRLFGTIQGDEVHCQGRVRFTDAVLIKGELVRERRFLRELSSPKPHHHATYGEGGKATGNIAGRKFYYHQGENPSFAVPEKDSNDRSSAIDEFAPRDTEFSFKVYIDNLEPEELGRLILAIELDEGLAHKMGMGKAIGLGSCRIVIDKKQSRISLPTQRYRSWAADEKQADEKQADEKRAADPTWYSLKPGWKKTLPPGLIEMLRLNKPAEGSIGYPGLSYPNQPIDALGAFGGKATAGGMPGAVARKPHFKPGDHVSAKRVEDPKGKNRQWFVADDGFGGRIVDKPEPQVKIDESLSLWIHSVLTDGYNFTARPPSSEAKTSKGADTGREKGKAKNTGL